MEGGCLQAGPPEPRTFSTPRGLGFVVQLLLGGLAERTGANPTIFRGEDLSISMSDLKAILAAFGPCCGPEGFFEINPGRML